MRKVAVISCNDNKDYLFYLPVVIDGWFKLGYDVHLFYMGGLLPKMTANIPKIHNRNLTVEIIKPINGIDDVTLVQCSRLFAACYFADDMQIVTSDVDMLVKKDMFTPKGSIDTYGRDLTDWHYPICYISMSAKKWREVMGIDITESLEANMERIIKAEPWHNSNESWQRWGTDQEIITKKLESVKGFVLHHDRGVDEVTGYPKGRLDRSGWKQPSGEIIDVHLPREPLNNYDKIAPLCGEWFSDYFNEFKKLYGTT